jgi:hypothetical protein
LLDWVWSRFAPQATQTALKRELGKLGKLVRGTRKKSAARELGKLVPPPIGGDEFQDEFACMKKTNTVRTSSAAYADRPQKADTPHSPWRIMIILLEVIENLLTHDRNVRCAFQASAPSTESQAVERPRPMRIEDINPWSLPGTR